MERKEVEAEKFLYGKKWFDYRPLTPDTATLLFLGEWAKALTEFYEVSGKTRHFSFLKKIESFDPAWINREKKGFWKTMEKLRRHADAGGYDYQDWWAWAFEALNELGFRVTFLNAFLSPRIKTKIAERKFEYDSHYVKRSASPFFRAENYTGNEIQNDYYDYLIFKTRRPDKDATRQALEVLIRSGELHVDYKSADCLIDRKATAC